MLFDASTIRIKAPSLVPNSVSFYVTKNKIIIIIVHLWVYTSHNSLVK